MTGPSSDTTANGSTSRGDARNDSIARTVSAYGATGAGYRAAHANSAGAFTAQAPPSRQRIEDFQDATLAAGATRASGAGNRARVEEPDPWRTCFQRDADRIRHAAAFRRLAGKTQVLFAPRHDLIRTRLTHSLEVAQIGETIARMLGLNTDLVQAMALGHDCGHGPGGHAAEAVFDTLLPDGWDHAAHGPTALAELNLCAEVLDGIAHHSWRLDAPATAEGEVLSWADRISYTAHDIDDFVRAGLLDPADLPADAEAATGGTHSGRVGFFVRAVVAASLDAGAVRMAEPDAAVLDTYRQFAFERIYLSPGVDQVNEAVSAMLESLVAYYSERPVLLGVDAGPGTVDTLTAAVGHVAGMTDRYAARAAVELLGWDPAQLPPTLA